jgi:hypothetical protein
MTDEFLRARPLKAGKCADSFIAKAMSIYTITYSKR